MATTHSRIVFRRRDPIDIIAEPFQRFFDAEAASGVLLMACVFVALAMVNFGFSDFYSGVLETRFGVVLEGVFSLDKPIILWINEGLMAFFFLLVGLEIKREVRVGELSNFRLAVLPLAAALGGMVVPAGLYLLVTWGNPSVVGWGVPMATDIAFALGVLALMGRQIPLGLKVFLAALAIVDDIGAVLVITLFYTADVALAALGLAAISFAALIGLNLLGVRSPLPYIIAGVLLWFFLLKSGIHATIAGVLMALTIPAEVKSTPGEFREIALSILERFSGCADTSRSDDCVLKNPEQHSALMQLKFLSRSAETPLQRIEHNLIHFVSFIVVPVFAMANAGMQFDAGVVESVSQPVSLGVVLGLFIGKPLGVAGASWLMVRFGLAKLPKMVTFGHIWGAGFLAGIGFTMSLFVAALAFGDPSLRGQVKLGILMASLASWLMGWFILTRCPSCIEEQLEQPENNVE